MVLFVQLIASNGIKVSWCRSNAGVIGMSVNHLVANCTYIVWRFLALWELIYGMMLCFVQKSWSNILSTEKGKPPCICKESKHVTCWKPKGASNQTYNLWMLAETCINATYVDELLCWYRFFLLQYSSLLSRPAKIYQPKNPSIPMAPCSAKEINSPICASVIGMNSTLTGFLGQIVCMVLSQGSFLDYEANTEFCWVG